MSRERLSAPWYVVVVVRDGKVERVYGDKTGHPFPTVEEADALLSGLYESGRGVIVQVEPSV